MLRGPYSLQPSDSWAHRNNPISIPTYSSSTRATSFGSPTSPVPATSTPILRPPLQIHRPVSAANNTNSVRISLVDQPLVRRKPALNPSLWAASAAQTIPPVPLLRSEDSTGSAAGKFHKSAPVNVPIWPKKVGDFGVKNLGHFDEGKAAEEMVPPHEIVARSNVTTFSVFEGVGRTLKGRDLRLVRNAVFQKTGFVD